MLVASWSEIAPSGQAERDGGVYVVAADVTEGVDGGHLNRGEGEGDDAQVGHGEGGRPRDDRGVRSRPSVSVRRRRPTAVGGSGGQIRVRVPEGCLRSDRLASPWGFCRDGARER